MSQKLERDSENPGSFSGDVSPFFVVDLFEGFIHLYSKNLF